jgi:hypothetical protein
MRALFHDPAPACALLAPHRDGDAEELARV